MEKRIILFFFLTLFITQINSQSFIRHDIEVEDFLNPRSTRVVDLNNDSHLDIVMMKINGVPQVSYWLNQGDGTFGNRVIIETNWGSTSGLPDDVATLDVNNDGYQDIVAGIVFNTLTANYYWWPNNQDGTFGDGILIAEGGNNLTDILIFDADNNGYDDIVTSDRSLNPTVNYLFYIPNLGNGTFGSRVTINNDEVTGLQAADVNDDNFKDLIYFQNDVLKLLINNQDGSFGTESVLSTGDFSIGYSINVADLDGDNIDDIVASGLSSTTTNSLVWYKGLGNGSFGTKNVLVSNEHLIILNSVIEDFNNDNKNDIAIPLSKLQGPTEYQSSWWKNNGNGSFDTASIISSNNENISGYDVRVADMNNDGKMDLIMGDRDGMYWYENNITLSQDDFNFNSIELYPNPSTGIFQINSSFDIIEKVKIFDSLGRLIKEENNFQITESIDLSNKVKGLYFIELSNKNNRSLKKIVIE